MTGIGFVTARLKITRITCWNYKLIRLKSNCPSYLPLIFLHEINLMRFSKYKTDNIRAIHGKVKFTAGQNLLWYYCLLF